jgi:hypothetical protein
MVRKRSLCYSVDNFYGITYTIVLYINLLSSFIGELEGINQMVSSLKPEKKEQLVELLGAKAGDLILFALGD